MAAGFTALEMREILNAKNFRDFKDRSSALGLNHVLSWKKLGLHKGDAFHRWISEHISLRLTGRRNESPRFDQMKKPLTIIATEIVRQQPKVFSTRRTPDVAVADAVRMSMSIPFFFIPVKYGQELVVDGGVLSNFPAWAFDEDRKSHPLPILGIRLQPDDSPPPRIKNQLSFAKAIINTMLRAGNQLQIDHIPDLHIIDVPTLGVRTTDFDISKKMKDDLYEAGYRTAQAFLATTSPFS